MFLASLWTLVGFYALVDRRKPRLTTQHVDYRYGLTLGGFLANFMPVDGPLPSQGGMLSFAVQVTNYSPGPIRYSLETAEIQIGTRAIPKYKRNSISGYLARGGSKQVAPDAFPAGSLKEFYGAGETKGTAGISITYGPPDGPPLRRLRLEVDLTLYFPAEGKTNPATGTALGVAVNITTEEDEPLTAP